MTGVDSSDPLIKICRAQFPEHHWILADMRQLALAQQFSGILAWDSFFHCARMIKTDVSDLS
jgi:trans-aconitate methyltransferase